MDADCEIERAKWASVQATLAIWCMAAHTWALPMSSAQFSLKPYRLSAVNADPIDGSERPVVN